MNNIERNAEIRRLRNEEGKSIREIVKILECPKSVVSYHCHGTKRLPQRSSGQPAQRQWQKKIDAVIEEAKAEWPDRFSNPKFMGFLGLYWGEGHKAKSIKGSTGPVGVTNNDPKLVGFMYQWFRILSPVQPHGVVTYYSGHKLDECQSVWELHLPAANLKFKANTDQRSGSDWCERCPYGRCMLRLSDYRLYWRLVTWLDCWKSGVL